jgi:hypothetical protein
MNRIGFRHFGSRNDAVNTQIRIFGWPGTDANGVIRGLKPRTIFVGFRINTDGFTTELSSSANDAESNLSPIGDQNAFKHGSGRPHQE